LGGRVKERSTTRAKEKKRRKRKQKNRKQEKEQKAKTGVQRVPLNGPLLGRIIRNKYTSHRFIIK